MGHAHSIDQGAGFANQGRRRRERGCDRRSWPRRLAVVQSDVPVVLEGPRTQSVCLSVRVAPGLYLIADLGPSAAYVVETTDGLILVDSGLDNDAARLKAEMAKLGLDWKRVRMILLTHAHGDHTGGAEALRLSTVPRCTPCRRRPCDFGRKTARGGLQHLLYARPYTSSDHRGRCFKGGETIALANVRVQAVAAPGHTPGSMCYLMDHGDYSLSSRET